MWKSQSRAADSEADSRRPHTSGGTLSASGARSVGQRSLAATQSSGSLRGASSPGELFGGRACPRWFDLPETRASAPSGLRPLASASVLESIVQRGGAPRPATAGVLGQTNGAGDATFEASVLTGRHVRLRLTEGDRGHAFRHPRKGKKLVNAQRARARKLADAFVPPWMDASLDGRLGRGSEAHGGGDGRKSALADGMYEKEVLLRQLAGPQIPRPPWSQEAVMGAAREQLHGTPQHSPGRSSGRGAARRPGSGASKVAAGAGLLGDVGRASLPQAVRDMVASAGAGWISLRGDTPLWMFDETLAYGEGNDRLDGTSATERAEHERLRRGRRGSDSSSMADSAGAGVGASLLPVEADWPEPAREVRGHLKDLQILVQKSLQRKLFEVWPFVEEAFGRGVVHEIVPNSNMFLNGEELAELLRSEDMFLVEADVQRVLVRSFWGKDDPRSAPLPYADFQAEWWPNDDDRRAWEPLALEKRKARAAEKARAAAQRREYEAQLARRRAAQAAVMKRALNNVLDTKALSTPAERVQGRLLLHRMLFGAKATESLAAPPLKINLRGARKKITDAYCSHRGLDGLTVVQATQIVHNYAAEFLQANCRRALVMKRMHKMQMMHKAALQRMMRSHFAAWHVVARWRISLKENCLRKVREWRYYLVQQKRRRQYFRVCFWPFYVWHRASHRSHIARQKAVFLVRLDRNYTCIRHFKAWSRFVADKLARRAKVAEERVRRLRRAARRSLQFWHDYAQVRSAKLALWRNKGQVLRKRVLDCHMRKYFVVWRYYASSRGLILARSFRYFSAKLHRKKVPVFPRVLKTTWGRELPKGDLHKWCSTVCEVLWIKMAQKDRYAIRINAMCFRRLAPRIFKAWVTYCEDEKKNRFAIWRGALLVQRHAFSQFVARVRHSISAREGTLDPEEMRIADEAERRRVAERQRVQRETDQKARESYKQEWVDEEGWRKASMAAQRGQAERLRHQAIEQRKAALQREKREAAAKRRDGFRREEIRSYLADEKQKTAEACVEAQVTAKKLLQRRAKELHDAMLKAYEQAEDAHMVHVMRSVLRSLRLPMMTRRSETLYRRAKLRNWCRICARYRYLWRAMPLYRKLRTQWVCWIKWLRFLDERLSKETPLLSEEVRRRRDVGQRFASLLCERSIDITTDEDVGRAATCDLKAVFLRWVELAQWRRCCRRLVEASCARGRSRFLHRAFASWAQRLKPMYTLADRRANPTFIERRAQADIAKLRLRLQNFYCALETQRIRRLWAWRRRAVKRRTLAEPTLKKVLAQLRANVDARQALERSLLLQAFGRRGLSEYVDEAVLPQGGEGGTYFVDDQAPPNTHVVQVVLNVGDSINGISLVTKSGSDTMRSPHRGKTTGSRVHWDLQEGEHLVRVEGVAGRFVNKIRFHSSKGRSSPWYGKLEVGERFSLSGNIGRGDVIVGFCGRSSRSSFDALGVLYRHTTEVNVFSSCWLPSEQEIGQGGVEQDMERKAEEQLSHILRMRACDIELTHDRTRRLATLMWRTVPAALPARGDVEQGSGKPKRKGDDAPAQRRDVPPPLDKLDVIRRFGCGWFFDSLSRGLLTLPRVEGEGQRKKREGELMAAKGAAQHNQANELLAGIDGYDAGGNHKLSASLLGAKRVKELLIEIEDLEDKRDKGLELKLRGQALAALGKSLMPTIPIHRARVMEYFMGLYKLAQTSSTLESVTTTSRRKN